MRVVGSQQETGEGAGCPFPPPWPTSPSRPVPSIINSQGKPAPWACKATKRVLKPKRLDVPKGLMLTRIAHRGMQEVHGRSGQAQPVHAIWGLFEVRHHANSRVEAPRRIQGAWRSAGLPPLSPSSCFVCGFGLWRQETGGNSHSQPSRLPGLVRGREPPQGAGGGTQATSYTEQSTRLYKALDQRPRLLREANFSGSPLLLFSWLEWAKYTHRVSLGARRG